MTFGERVFLYCERGSSEALFAEPINAVSNAAYLLAALAGFLLVLRRPPEERNADQFLLPVLVLFIGLGSLAFHLYADRGTALADVVPISLFMLVYFGFALNCFLGVPPAWTTLAVLGFTAIVAITMQVRCGEDFIGFPGSGVEGVKPCLNGSLFYFPALVALMVVGLILSESGHKAAPWLLWAAAIFALSIALRSLDLALCDKAVLEGRKVGTHFAWHVLNALALFLLLRASLEGGPDSVTRSEIIPVVFETFEPRIETPVEAMPVENLPESKPLLERVVSATEREADETEAPDKEGERKPFFPT